MNYFVIGRVSHAPIFRHKLSFHSFKSCCIFFQGNTRVKAEYVSISQTVLAIFIKLKTKFVYQLVNRSQASIIVEELPRNQPREPWHMSGVQLTSSVISPNWTGLTKWLKARHTCIPVTGLTSDVGNILHTQILQLLKAKETGSCIWDHATNCGQEATVKCTDAAFLE